jgi:hypothetical protein
LRLGEQSPGAVGEAVLASVVGKLSLESSNVLPELQNNMIEGPILFASFLPQDVFGHDSLAPDDDGENI